MSDPSVNHIQYTVDTISSGLLERAQQDDAEAWSRLVFLFGPLVFHWCLAKGLQSADAKDVSQQVFYKVSEKLVDFSRDRANATFRGWLRTITYHKICDFWRTTTTVPLPPETPIPEDEQSCREELKIVSRRIIEWGGENINPKHWEIFLKVVMYGEQPIDVAANLGEKRDNVDQIKKRVLAKLRKEFGDVFG